MKILHTEWFTGRECIGIVVTENEIGERKAYIGLASGLNEGSDKKRIAESGSKIMKERLQAVIDKMDKK